MDSNTKYIENSNKVRYTVFESQLLGEGQFGKVYKGEFEDTNGQKQQVAIKKIVYTLPKGVTPQYFNERIQAEEKLWRVCSHPNVVTFYDFIKTPDCFYFVSEYCDGESMDKILEKGRTNQALATSWMKSLTDALVYLHKLNIIHRDIKPANIVFSGGVPKIIDFGLAKEFSNQGHTVGLGTPIYMAPELLQNFHNLQKYPYTRKVDIWALGLIFYQLVYGKSAWDFTGCRDENDVFNRIDDKPEVIIPQTPQLPSETKALIQSMLEVEEENRIDSEELLAAFESQ